MSPGPGESKGEGPQFNVNVRHFERSLILSMDDDVGKATPELVDLAIRAASEARTVDLTHISQRITAGPRWPDVWPGEHYKLLAGIVKVLQPRTAVEIGTEKGLSALSLLKYAPPDARLVTFDLIPWKQCPGHVLRDSDFADGRLIQHLDDLSQSIGFGKHRALIESADLIFVDAAKDGAQEWRFLHYFAQCRFREPPLIVFDDIRVWNMLAVWRSIDRPKLDLTSFGHWSGTGLVRWT